MYEPQLLEGWIVLSIKKHYLLDNNNSNNKTFLKVSEGI